MCEELRTLRVPSSGRPFQVPARRPWRAVLPNSSVVVIRLEDVVRKQVSRESSREFLEAKITETSQSTKEMMRTTEEAVGGFSV